MEYKQYEHLMLDIETFGTDNDSVICSIGAVEFDINTGETGKEFYAKIDIQSCLDAGLKVSGSTLLWWLKQSEDARKELYDANTQSLVTVLHLFAQFMKGCKPDVEIWGNSNRFDMGILQTAYNKIGIPIPWNFRKERDVRTLVSFNPGIQKNMPFDGVAHNPVADCKYQIKYCTAIWKSLTEPKTIVENTKTFVVNTENIPDANTARKAIMDIMNMYKGKIHLDNEWVLENILLPEDSN